MAKTTPALIDLPEFGDLNEWRAALQELQSLPSSPEVAEAIDRCHREIAELTGEEPPGALDRMDDFEFEIEPAE